ncbi:MAG TPA: hypothetical protein P5537_02230 [Thauera sp.]|uniref:hypothetical protein n=1 Tax=Thauera sp. TaxID=1905334 RepID=UPI002B654B24|nr:hypothetical protein [Thauera sp.]HPE03095.1 hypothetical protein [Thauera sp.]HRV76891.1 hypothetical protein [Thauera sp.]
MKHASEADLRACRRSYMNRRASAPCRSGGSRESGRSVIDACQSPAAAIAPAGAPT